MRTHKAQRACIAGLLAGLGLATGCALYSASAQQAQRLTNFTFPQFDLKTRAKTSEISGAAATMQGDTVDIVDARLEVFDKGRTEMVATSPGCRFHQAKRKVDSTNTVRIVRDGMVVTGRGFAWKSKHDVFIVRNDTRVVLVGLARPDTGEDE